MVDVVEIKPITIEEQFFLDAGQAIGVEPERLINLVEVMEERGIICHGIQHGVHLAEAVKTQGVKPLTPEGGSISCWNKGIWVFGDTSRKFASLGGIYNSTFFNWAHTQNKVGQEIMTLVISTIDRWRSKGISFKGESEICTHEIVEPNDFCWLQVKADSHKEVQRKMFELMEEVIMAGEIPWGEQFCRD